MKQKVRQGRNHRGRRHGLVLTLALLVLVACTGNPIIDTALNIGKNMLKAAVSSAVPGYKDDLSKLVEALVAVPQAALVKQPDGTYGNASLDAIESNLADGGDGGTSAGGGGGSGDGMGSSMMTGLADIGYIPEEQRQPIELDVSVLKEAQLASGEWRPIEIEDGDSVQQEELVKFLVRSKAPVYLYIIGVDATGYVQALFPNDDEDFSVSHSNPIQANVLYNFPDGSEWFELDEYKGIQTLYFVAAYEQQPKIEKALAKLATYGRPELPKDVETMSEPDVVERGFARKRQSRQSAEVTTQDNRRHDVQPVKFLADMDAGVGMVITRYFLHE